MKWFFEGCCIAMNEKQYCLDIIRAMGYDMFVPSTPGVNSRYYFIKSCVIGSLPIISIYLPCMI